MAFPFLHNIAIRLARATAPEATRRFDAAGGARRWGSSPSFGPINAETLAAAGPMRSRARHAHRNNGTAAATSNAWVANLIGTGIVPASLHPDPAVRKRLAQAHRQWSNRADADGVTDRAGVEALAARSMIEAGECFVQLLTVEGVPGVPLRLRLIDPDQVDFAHTRELAGGGRIIAGIEFDTVGNRVAYHVTQANAFGMTGSTVRVQAADMLHLYQQLAPGQVRGIPWVSPALLTLYDLDALQDAMLEKQKVSALFAGFMVDPSQDTSPAQLTGLEQDMPSLEPGTIQALPPGYDMKFATPAEASDGVAFIKSQLRLIATGVGLPTHLVSGDLSDFNFSSLRGGLIEFRRRVEQIQFSVVVHQLCRPVWERFVTLAVLSGVVEAPDFEAAVEDYLSAEFYPPKQAWVDPAKDAAADADAVAAGFKSRRQVVAELGYAIEDLDAEIASDKAREEALGLHFTAPTPAATLPGAP
jgi:lambda family phage portal protein